MSYLERGHSLTTRRGKSTLHQRLLRQAEETYVSDPILKQIDDWQKEHRHIKGTLQEFSDWWKGVWADFNDDCEDILEYLESLCNDCLTETVNQKGRRMCPDCKTIKGEYK